MSNIAVPDVALVIFTTLIIPSTTISTISIYYAASTANATLSMPVSLLNPDPRAISAITKFPVTQSYLPLAWSCEWNFINTTTLIKPTLDPDYSLSINDSRTVGAVPTSPQYGELTFFNLGIGACRESMASKDLAAAIPWQVYVLHKSWSDSNQVVFCNRAIAVWDEIQSMDFIVKDRCKL